ncbi:MAG: LLM class flavin-dependent oxidoreductase [Actinomycetota bacterium]|nr:LLM class flavin-dependent oxidoreductase [Actinomycetota bacterium]
MLVGSIVSRPPTLFAKEAQTVDHLTGGRLELGLGAGGAPTDQMMWGVDDWAPRERADRFAECVELVDALCRGDDVNFLGRWYETSGARTAPGFVQVPRPRWSLPPMARGRSR